jgi:hypothetical protein
VQAVQTLKSIDTTIIGYLKRGPEGVAELYKSLGVDMPNGAQNNPTSQQQQQNIPDLDTFGDDDFLDGRMVKALLPKLVSQAVEQLNGHVKPIQDKFAQLAPLLQNVVQTNNELAETTRAINDTRTIVSQLSQYYPDDFKLNADPADIWQESIGMDGRVKANHHPEFPRLAAILRARQEAAKAGYPNPVAYLAEKMVREGRVSKMLDDKAGNVRVTIAQNKMREMQPSFANEKKPGQQDSFRMPQTPEEVEALKNNNPRQYEEFRQRIKAGRF